MSRRYNSADTIVLWDVEDCPIPDGLDATYVKHNIRMGLKDEGYHGRILSIHAYGDWAHMKHDFAGFAVINCPDRVERRTMMLMDFLNTAVGKTGLVKLNLMLILGDISGDVGFLGAIQEMELYGKFNVLLSQPQTPSGNKIYGVRTIWLWNKLATGEDLSHQN